MTTGKINNTAVDKAKLNTDVAGGGLTGGGGAALAVGAVAASAIAVNANDIAVATDDSTLEDDGGTPGALRVKDLGIVEGKLGNLSVATGKIQNDAVDETKLDLAKTYDFSAAGGVKVATPSVDADAASKGYVDSVAQGLTIKDPCRVATAAALPAYTMGGGPGPGRTLTINAVGILTVDGVNTVLGDRILVKDEAGTGSPGKYDHGIYEVTTEGTGGVAAVLTRVTDFDTDAEVVGGSFSFVEEGSTQADTGWVLTTDNPITVDSTDLDFAQFSGAGTYTGGDGIDITGAVVSADLKTSGGLKIDTGEVAVEPANFAGTGLEDDGSDNLQLAAQGNGITGGAGSTLSVLADPTTGPSVAVGAAGVRAAVPYIGDKEQAPADTSGDDFDTGITVTVTPANPSNMAVFVNGLRVLVGNGVSTKDCYFSSDGTEPNKRAINAIVAGDHFMWNGTIAAYQLKVAKDIVDFDYAYVV